MARYFKIMEIDCDSFIEATGEDLEYSQLIVNTNDGVFIAVDDSNEYELSVPLDIFDD